MSSSQLALRRWWANQALQTLDAQPLNAVLFSPTGSFSLTQLRPEAVMSSSCWLFLMAEGEANLLVP